MNNTISNTISNTVNNIKLVKHKYEHYLSKNINIEMDINSVHNYNLHIVYYINCMVNRNYMDWLINQIYLIRNYNATIYIVSTIPKYKEHIFKELVYKLFPKVHIECYYTNEFEYRGILKAWEL